MHNHLLIFLLFSLSLACTPDATQEASERQPNVILIITDDQGYGDIAAHGNPWIQTPNLDQLYAESTRFTDFHVATTCAPTRAGLMTGINCNQVGVWHTIIGRSLLKQDFITMPEIFQQHGYRTGMFGKWHLGDNYPFRPQDRGFEESVVHGGGGVGQTPDYWNNDYFDDTYFHNGEPKKYKGYCTDVWFREVARFIEENQDQPFFCYLSTNAPHSPYHVPQNYIEMYADQPEVPNPNFYGMITNIDENIGRLEELLAEKGLRENTILLFMTDNGTSAGADLSQEQFVEKGFNAGMRGKKGSPYEGGHRVPLFIRWPGGKVPAAKDVSILSAYTDLLPTLLDLCGMKAPETADFHGTSLQPLIMEDSPEWPERTLITDTQREENLMKGKAASVMTERWRLVFGNELYDMQNDPGQATNVADQHPEVVRQLQQDYDKWWQEVSQGSDEYARIIIGSEAENPVTLTCHDFHPTEPGYPAWNQKMIRRASNIQGFWTLEVAEAGDYQIELRRWPREADALITGNVPPGEPVSGGDAYPEGKILPIIKAGIRLGGQEISAPVEDEQAGVTFDVNLAAGPVELTSWYKDAEGHEYGGYYVYITRK
ncbi:MAG: arylsulfatase [Cyclobacteriaceae bacterium]